MNFQQLRIIQETVRRKYNLTDVANALRTAQSGVSRHVKELELELGVEIFVRQGKRLLGLTDAGKEVVEIVERMLLDRNNLSQLGQRFSIGDEGVLRIATTHTQARYALPPVIARFKAAFPKVALDLRQGRAADIPALLVEGEADIGIATDLMQREGDLVVFPSGSWEQAVIVPKGHALEGVARLTLRLLADWPIITYADGVNGRPDIDAAFARANLDPEIVMSALDADVIKSCVELGLGVGIVSELDFDPVRDGALRRIASPDFFARNISSIGLRRGRRLRGYTYRFIEILVPELTESVVKSTADRAYQRSL
jgi:LysR family transcriptional regulator, cys regulon transcriptional activator